MGRILVVVLGLAVVIGAAYYYLTGHVAGRSEADVDVPSAQLDHVKDRSHELEQQMQKNADHIQDETKSP